MKKRVLCIAGTRPEIIKLAPVIKALKSTSWAQVVTAASGQHREMAAAAFRSFDLVPDFDLEVMSKNQSLSALTSRLLAVLEPTLGEIAPDIVIAQGDTTTVMAVAISCFYLGIPFAHVEAGLRTDKLNDPFPEEFNRVVCGKLAAVHFAPTDAASSALISEGVSPEKIAVTGNTVIDAVTSTRGNPPIDVDPTRKLILMTAHRRENFGEPLKRVFQAMSDLLSTRDDIELLYPVHPNPNVADMAREIFRNSPRAKLCDPLHYQEFVGAMRHAYLIVSDSGGVQEEAPALGKPVLVTRNETERPDAVEAGGAKLVGTDYDKVRGSVLELLDNENAYRIMARGMSPYGDGKAAERIVDFLETYFGLKAQRLTSDFDATTWLAQGVE